MEDPAEDVIEIPYEPRPLQLEIHDQLDAHRFGAVVCHRRFGKTVAAINHLVKAALTNNRERPRYGYVAPTYTQGKAIAWDYLKHYVAPIPGVSVNESELRVDLPGDRRIRIFGADNPDSMRGLYFDGAVLDEFGLMKAAAWSEVIRPALSDRKGWALFIGTPNGRNAFYEVCQLAKNGGDWFFAEYKASDTKVIDEGELASAKTQMTADEYAQEYECSFEASVRGAVYAREIIAARSEGRIHRCPYDPALPVHTAWDLGVGDATAIWFAQAVGSEVRVIDYHESSGEGLQHYAAVLDKKGYKYGQHFGPHDIKVRELSTGKSRFEIAQGLGLTFQVCPQHKLEDGINAGRMMFPRLYFDQAKTQAGLDALQNYRWDFNQRLDEFKAVPVHDWASHGADAYRILAMMLRQPTTHKPIDYSVLGRVT